MNVIKLESSEDTPKIVLDAANNEFEISGRSIPEDSAAFYKPILEWIDSYSSKPNPKTNFVFNLEYFNTSSSKLILDILTKLESLHQRGNDMVITWCYREDDEDMQDAGEEYAELVQIPFELKVTT